MRVTEKKKNLTFNRYTDQGCSLPQETCLETTPHHEEKNLQKKKIDKSSSMKMNGTINRPKRP